MKKVLRVLFVLLFSTFLFAQERGAEYLIITPDAFYDAVMPLAQWKVKKGITTKVVKTSETGTSATQIKNYILNAYNTWQIRPHYLLIAGGPNLIPFQYVNDIMSDNYYTNMDGDLFNEIISGRITASNLTQMQTVVNKILLYERTPYMQDTTWFLKGTTIVNLDYDPSDDAIYWDDARYAKACMLEAGYILVDTLCDAFGDNSTTVMNRVNDGRSFVLYRGSGVNNWWSPFDVVPDNLSNGPKMPIVVSATCRTIGTSGNPCTAEMWLLTGTPTLPRGAAAYFATTTTRTSAAQYRSVIARVFFGSVFSGVNTFGDACEEARLKLYAAYPGDEDYYGFHALGDPTMQIWTGVPRSLEVAYSSLPECGSEDTLTLTITHNSAPVESAYVCVMRDTLIYLTGYTADNGTVSFSISPCDAGYLYITITGRNLHPYEDSIPILPQGDPYIVVYSREFEEIGDGNGTIDPGESFLLWTNLVNIGQATAYGVTGVISTSDSTVFISDSISEFGDILPGDSASNLKPYVASISPQAGNNTVVNFNLVLNDSLNNCWSYNVSVYFNFPSSGETGPDPYGYYIYDNTDTLSGYAPVYQWFEIAGCGTTITRVTNADADTETISLPFTFKFYGINYTSIGVCSNGFVEMGTSTHRFGSNGAIPASGGPKRLIAPFWDDINPYLYGDVYQYYDSQNHRFIIEYYQCAHYEQPSIRETFQIVLLDPAYYPTPTGDGEILFLYNTVSNASSCTIGIEDHTETRGLQYLCNNVYARNASNLTAGRALLITTKIPIRITSPWVEVTGWNIDDSSFGNGNGSPEPGETVSLIVTLSNSGASDITALTSVLRACEPYISVLDSIAEFDYLGIGEEISNYDDPYIFQINSSAVPGFTGFMLHMTGNGGSYEGFGYLNIEIVPSASVNDAASLMPSVKMYPNPFSNKFNIVVRSGSGGDEVDVRIFDATGRQVKSFSSRSSPSSFYWNGSDQHGQILPSGIYFVWIKTGSFQKVERIIKVR